MSLARDRDTAEGTIYNERGRTTLPKEVREKLGLEEGDEYVCVMGDGVVKLMEKGRYYSLAIDAGLVE
jgi:AbrB family looped-hinge helix DNA binding protein